MQYGDKLSETFLFFFVVASYRGNCLKKRPNSVLNGMMQAFKFVKKRLTHQSKLESFLYHLRKNQLIWSEYNGDIQFSFWQVTFETPCINNSPTQKHCSPNKVFHSCREFHYFQISEKNVFLSNYFRFSHSKCNL